MAPTNKSRDMTSLTSHDALPSASANRKKGKHIGLILLVVLIFSMVALGVRGGGSIVWDKKMQATDPDVKTDRGAHQEILSDIVARDEENGVHQDASPHDTGTGSPESECKPREDQLIIVDAEDNHSSVRPITNSTTAKESTSAPAIGNPTLVSSPLRQIGTAKTSSSVSDFGRRRGLEQVLDYVNPGMNSMSFSQGLSFDFTMNLASTKAEKSSTKAAKYSTKAAKTGKSSSVTNTCVGPAYVSDAQCLYQSDFDNGSMVITTSGSYKLCGNIVFAPRKPNLATATDEDIANAFDPKAVGDDQFNTNMFSMGYFAALCIEANDVTLFLNGYTIEQDPSHALLQRFFAIIELASSPFIPFVGPADFVGDSPFFSAKNFQLVGPGKMGLSSHHGVHGNDNENVTVCDVTFVDFEVAAVSLNNVDGLTIENCDIPHNRHDVPVLGIFSAARQILPFVMALKELSRPYEMPLRGVMTSSTTVYHALVSAIANVYKDVMATGFIDEATHPMEYKLFHNVHHAVDGPCYAFLVHGKGPAVGGQGFELSPDSTTISSDVEISNNSIQHMKCWTNEIPGVVIDGVVQNDARGGVLQLISTIYNEWIASDANGHYTGNVLTDAQIMVARAIQDNTLVNDSILQTRVNTIDSSIVSWAEDPAETFSPDFRCNGDSMHHVIKGSIMIRVEDTQGFKISSNTITSALVVSGPQAASEAYFGLFPGTDVTWNCPSYHQGASIEYENQQQLADLRGISVAAVSKYLDSRKSLIYGNTITHFDSQYATDIVGIDIQGMSEGIIVSHNTVDLKSGVGTDPTDKYIACRVRAYSSQGDIVKINNTIAQEEFWEPFDMAFERRLRLRKVPKNHPMSMEPEWAYGGCPMGHPHRA